MTSNTATNVDQIGEVGAVLLVILYKDELILIGCGSDLGN